MTRQRKEIYKEINELYIQEQVEYEMGCGFFTSEIAEAFAPAKEKLYERLAKTYGLTAQEYEGKQYEIGNRLVAVDVIPFSYFSFN